MLPLGSLKAPPIGFYLRPLAHCLALLQSYKRIIGRLRLFASFYLPHNTVASIQIYFFWGGGRFYWVDSRIQIKRYSRPGIFYWGGGAIPPRPSGIDATATTLRCCRTLNTVLLTNKLGYVTRPSIFSRSQLFNKKNFSKRDNCYLKKFPTITELHQVHPVLAYNRTLILHTITKVYKPTKSTIFYITVSIGTTRVSEKAELTSIINASTQ